jgi:hypothetical protein
MGSHLAGAVATGLILAGCGGGSVPAVAWVDYVPGLKVDLETATRATDCALLSAYREMAIDGDLLESKPREVPNTDLVEYIEWSLQEAGCW